MTDTEERRVITVEDLMIRRESDIRKNLSFLRERGHVISLAGGGGKTTWMYVLGFCGKKLGYRTLLSTTTHTHKPPFLLERWREIDKIQPDSMIGRLMGEKDLFVWAKSLEDVENTWAQGRIPVLGEECGEKKLKMPLESVLGAAMAEADLTLIEADGSRGMPCKVPGKGEPVFLEESDMVLTVAGMSAVGRKTCEVCFRSGAGETQRMTASALARLLSSERGGRKNVGERFYAVLLNQCDTEERIQEAERVRDILRENGIEHVFLSSFCRGSE